VRVNKGEVAEWLDRYVAAWKTYDGRDIAALFTDAAEYRCHPYDADPVRGGEAIAEKWLEEPDPSGTYDGSYEPIAVDGDVAVAMGTSTYLTPDGSVERIYDNCFIMRFDASGRCSLFTEWYMKRPV
jgi:SnoaL-like domain